jgi:hypothetical protein
VAITEDVSTPAIVQQTGSGSTITSASFSPPAGSLLLVLVGGGWGNSGAMTASVTDSKGGAWTTAVTAAGTNTSLRGIAAIYYRYLSTAPGAMTVTATFTNLSGGKELAVRVINGASGSQSGTGTGSVINSTATTAGTVSITTTVTGSAVYGISDDATTNGAYTVNGATSVLSGTPTGDFNDATDSVRLVAWKATSATGTPGATTLGGTWSSAGVNNIAAFEVIPPTTFSGAATLSSVSTLTADATVQGPPKATMISVATLSVTPSPVKVPGFPNKPRTLSVEMFLNNNWLDVSADVYARDGISITHGAKDESSRADPCRCTLTLNNRSGNYSPRNPMGLYFGSLGRNTPLRLAVGKDRDTFSRTISAGWGNTDIGNTWTTFGSGGTVAGSDFNVTPSGGTMSVPVNDGTRGTYIDNQIYGDVDVSVTFSLSLASVTGQAVEPAGVILHCIDINNYAVVTPYVDTATGRYFIDVADVIGGTVASLLSTTVDTGVSYVGSQQVRVRVIIEGSVIFAKLWRASNNEPYFWHVSVQTGWTAPGFVGLQSYVDPSNTNTKPILFTYDNLVVRIPRFAGEVSYWPQRWDVSGTDYFVPIEASGVKRRLSQGAAPLDSARRSDISKTITTLAYWPCEEGASSSELGPTIGHYPMTISGTVKFAEFSGFICSLPLPTLDVGSWTGRISTSASTGFVALQFLLHVPTSEPPDNFAISRLVTSGTGHVWEVRYRTGGILSLVASASGATILDTGGTTVIVIDKLMLITLALAQTGSDIAWRLGTLEVGATLAFVSAGTVTGRTLGIARSVAIDPSKQLKGVSVGHIAVRNDEALEFDTAFSFNAFSGFPEVGGETAGNRIYRLTTSAGVPLAFQGNLNDSVLMGAQRPLSLLTLLEEAADADMGLLFESRSSLGLKFRPRKTLYNQIPALSLNYSAGSVAPPLEPVDDDQQTRNDILLKRTNGSNFEIFLSTGRLSIVDPWMGGVGAYQDAPEVNVGFDSQLQDIAGWRLLLGTVDEARYPTIKVNLASPTVVAAELDNAVMTINVGDRIEIDSPPLAITPNSISQIVRGYTETLNVFEHTISFVCAPASPYDVIRSGEPGMMAVDSDASTLSVAVNSTVATLSVATTAGHSLWGTGAVNLDIAIDGERITVTNISGASSPQTFTVTRSVNGVSKAHSAGASVSLFRPALVGL